MAERSSLPIISELAAQLGGHEGQGHPLLLEVAINRFNVQAHFFRNDVNHGACGQGRVEVHEAGIETETGVGGDAICFLYPVVSSIPGAEVGHIVVMDTDPFGFSGGPAGVEDDEKVFLTGAWGQVAKGQVSDVLSVKPLALIARDDLAEGFVGHKEADFRILEHKLQPVSRIAGIKGQVGRPALQYSQTPDRHHFVSAYQDAHTVTPPYAPSGQFAGQAVSQIVKGSIVKQGVLGANGRAVGLAEDLLSELVHDGQVPGLIIFHPGKVLQEAAALFFWQIQGLSQGKPGVGTDPLQADSELVGHVFHNLGQVEVWGVGQLETLEISLPEDLQLKVDGEALVGPVLVDSLEIVRLYDWQTANVIYQEIVDRISRGNPVQLQLADKLVQGVVLIALGLVEQGLDLGKVGIKIVSAQGFHPDRHSVGKHAHN